MARQEEDEAACRKKRDGGSGGTATRENERNESAPVEMDGVASGRGRGRMRETEIYGVREGKWSTRVRLIRFIAA